jgi:hypothetical protein
MREAAVFLYPPQDGIVRAKIPVIRGLVISAPDRGLVEHLASCALAERRPGVKAVFIDVSPEAAVEPNPALDMAGIFADDLTFDEFLEEMRAARERDQELEGL